MVRNFRRPDSNKNRYDAPKPRLVSIRQDRKEKEMRDELSGEAEKKAIQSVTLPKFSWDK